MVSGFEALLFIITISIGSGQVQTVVIPMNHMTDCVTLESKINNDKDMTILGQNSNRPVAYVFASCKTTER